MCPATMTTTRLLSVCSPFWQPTIRPTATASQQHNDIRLTSRWMLSSFQSQSRITRIKQLKCIAPYAPDDYVHTHTNTQFTCPHPSIQFIYINLIRIYLFMHSIQASLFLYVAHFGNGKIWVLFLCVCRFRIASPTLNGTVCAGIIKLNQ